MRVEQGMPDTGSVRYPRALMPASASASHLYFPQS